METQPHLLNLFSPKPGQGTAYRQLARFIEGLIRSGLLLRGTRLPAERQAAVALALSRTTVAAAYAQLVSIGLADARPGSGTYVAVGDGPAPVATAAAPGDVPPPWAEPPPVTLECLLNTACDAQLISLGSQQALDLIARYFLRPGDSVLVERPTYIGAIQLFKALGAQVVEVDVHPHDAGRLANQLRRLSPRLFYVVPSFRNPTGHLMDRGEREKVLELARALRVPVVEDEAYRELWFDEPPPPPLRTLAGRAGDPSVIAVGTVSKLLTPAFRLGWVWANPQVVRRLTRIKQVSDLHTSTLSQAVVLECLRSGLLASHVVRLRSLYRTRRDGWPA